MLNAKCKIYSVISTSIDRLDKIIAQKFPHFSRSYISQLIKNNFVQINNTIITKPAHQSRVGDNITIKIPPPTLIELIPKNEKLDIIFANQDILVINKPPFLPVHPSHGHVNDTLINILIHHFPKFKEFAPINGIHRPGIVHRLDQNTSGLIVVAKNQTAQQKLSQDLKNKKWTKKYLAVVLNNLEKSKGVIQKNIIRDPHHRQKFTTTSLDKGKTAITHFKVIKNINIAKQNLSLVEILLETGRTHQIRVHLASEDMPILGDNLYFSKESQKISKLLKINRQLLHSYYLKIIHPTTSKPIKFETNPPTDFDFIFKK